MPYSLSLLWSALILWRVRKTSLSRSPSKMALLSTSPMSNKIIQPTTRLHPPHRLMKATGLPGSKIHQFSWAGSCLMTTTISWPRKATRYGPVPWVLPGMSSRSLFYREKMQNLKIRTNFKTKLCPILIRNCLLVTNYLLKVTTLHRDMVNQQLIG